MIHLRTYRHLQLFCGVGGLSAGIQRSAEQHAGLVGRWKCVAAVDSDPATIAAYNAYTGTAVGHVVDLFDREQYAAFHGHEPPAGWTETTPETLRALCGGRSPHLIASSPPCKGLSALLPEAAAATPKYQALNGLVLRGIWLALEAFADDPVPFWLLENVPRIQTRGRRFLDLVEGMLRTYGYSITGSEHCCGELGGLAQRRRRYLLVARHTGKVQVFLYRPEARPLRTVGEVVGTLPMPGDPRAGAIHAPRRVSFRTALRLALIPPGKDWRALRDLIVVDGVLADYRMIPVGTAWQKAVLGVRRWDEPSGTVTGEAHATTGAFSVADPRPTYRHEYGMRIHPFGGVAHTVTGADAAAGQHVADPRPAEPSAEFKMLRVAAWDSHTGAITTARAGNGQHVADPRPAGAPGLVLADPRTDRDREGGGAWRGSGPYGVVGWEAQSGAVTAAADAASGPHSVADPRGEQQAIPNADERGDWVILSPHGGGWHRPFTTLELAALQSLVTAEDLAAIERGDLVGPAALASLGASDTQLRQWVGNAVPVAAAEAIGGVILLALLAADAGESFQLSYQTPWCLPRRIAIGLAVEGAPLDPPAPSPTQETTP